MDVGSFSVGIDWKYETKQFGKKVSKQYLVKPHYKDLKLEMLNYKYLQQKEFKNIMMKAKKYVDTTIAKSMINRHGRKKQNKKPLQLNHLISIIMYCDYTELSRDFTVSFRKSHQFQLLKQIKKHNSMYYHWAKTLRQLIREYGQNHEQGNGCLSKLMGPFYCGMSVVLSVPQCNMFIHGPLSTSIHLEVSLKFSGESGMILELDNSKGRCKDLRAMDVSWISRYREEDERYLPVLLSNSLKSGCF